MSNERYVGERRALWHFLAELQPLIEAMLGTDALLHHRIDRALKAGDLDSLRDARRMFHCLPDDQKRRLMRGIFEETRMTVGKPSASKAKMPASPRTTTGDAPATTICFNAFPAMQSEDTALSVELDDEAGGRPAPIQVMIKPGTLPRSAAETLRQIANWIEHDRRLLSTQHWMHGDKLTRLASDTSDQA